MTDTLAGSSAPTEEVVTARPPSGMSPLELLRWTWRQLTSMRTALMLLFLLALAAIPGSVIPQRDIDAAAVSRWQESHPTLTPVYEWLGMFSVFDSAWFGAIYVLLMVSLVGCILPRTRIYWRGLRARPPRPPRNLSRLPEFRRFLVDDHPDVVLERARAALRKRRYRVDVHPDAVAAERGYLREAGNLVFHVAVLVVLTGFAMGSLLGYKGGVIVVSGQGFSNSLSQYDDFSPGSLFDPAGLSPFSLSVDDFRVSFLGEGPQAGMPTDFSADVTYTESPGVPPSTTRLAVNDPLSVPGGDVFLVGHGYAPRVTVRDGNGDLAYQGPVVFLPQDATFASIGVIKVPDARPQQLAFEGLFLPTYGFTMASGPFSRFPDALNPVLTMLPYTGDLGLDSGTPQSVYSLDTDRLDTFAKPGGGDFRTDLALGQTKRLPNGAGSITFDGVDRWVKLQISDSPGKGIALAGVLLAIAGLLGSLFIRPRRAWVRVGVREGSTVVEVGGLDRTSGGSLAEELEALETAVRTPSPAPTRPEEDA